MNTDPMFSLYDLLPAIHRIDDEKYGHALRGLFAVIEHQAAALKLNIDELYDDFFIETCAEWVIPYLGQLVANNPLPEVLSTRRADVARTLYYRRRKGTLTMLEELSRDVTGWSVRVTPFFETLSWAQNVNHLRPASSTARVRNIQEMDRVGTAFNGSSHTLDVRRAAQREGWHHQRHAGAFCWRLHNFHVEGARALRQTAPNSHGFTFDPAGASAPLFNRPHDLAQGEVTAEIHVRAPIRPMAFHAAPAEYYNPNVSPSVSKDGQGVGTDSVVYMNLALWAQPAAGKVGVDTRLGRISFAAGESPVSGAAVSYGQGPMIDAVQETAPNQHGYRFPLMGVAFFHDGAYVPVSRLIYQDLGAWTQPAAGSVAVDLGLGRVAFAAGEEPSTDLLVQFGENVFQKAVQTVSPNAHGYTFHPPSNSRSLQITADGAPYALAQLFCVNLENWVRPPSGRVGIDVGRGRISFPLNEEPTGAVVVSYDCGFSAGTGGGSYDRTAPLKPGETLTTPAADLLLHPDRDNLIRVGRSGLNTINEALTQWRNSGRVKTVIQIDDSRTYAENLLLDGPSDGLVIQAANRERPIIAGSIVTDGGAGEGSVVLSGLWITGPLTAAGNLKSLLVSHCSITPANPGAIVLQPSNVSIAVSIERSITGGIQLALGSTLNFSDGIIDAPATAIAGAATVQIVRSTVWGQVTVRELTLASETIFTAKLTIARRQSGCVRYCFLPTDSVTPKRYRCQPEAAIDEAPASQKPLVQARLKPRFTSISAGHPGYAQLHLNCPVEIAQGGEDGGEMGAFHLLQQPRRLESLRLRFDEYLPFGIDAAIVFVT